MVDTRKLRSQMVLKGYTIKTLAEKIGISEKTLSTKINKTPNKFTQEEMSEIVHALDIENPVNIFFA